MDPSFIEAESDTVNSLMSALKTHATLGSKDAKPQVDKSVTYSFKTNEDGYPLLDDEWRTMNARDQGRYIRSYATLCYSKLLLTVLSATP
jgi:hypothetical protein